MSGSLGFNDLDRGGVGVVITTSTGGVSGSLVHGNAHISKFSIVSWPSGRSFGADFGPEIKI